MIDTCGCYCYGMEKAADELFTARDTYVCAVVLSV